MIAQIFALNNLKWLAKETLMATTYRFYDLSS